MPRLLRRLLAVAVLVALVVAGVVGLARALPLIDTAPPELATWSAPLGGATQMDVQVGLSAGDLVLGGSLPAASPVPSDTAAVAVSTLPGGVTPDWAWSLAGDTGYLQVGARTGGFPESVLAVVDDAGAPGWAVGLNGSVPVDLRVDTLRGDIRADLAALQVSDFAIQVSVGDASVVLGDGTMGGAVRVGLGSADVLVPESLPVRVSARVGGTVTATDLSYDGTGYVTDAFLNRRDGVPGIEVSVEVGSGDLNIGTLKPAGTGPAASAPAESIPYAAVPPPGLARAASVPASWMTGPSRARRGPRLSRPRRVARGTAVRATVDSVARYRRP